MSLPSPALPAPDPSPRGADPLPVPGFYASLLAHPDTTGFTPDESMLASIRAHLQKRHVDRPTDAQLYAGVAREVECLLLEVGLPTTGLAGLPRDASLPGRLVRLYGSRVPRGVLYYAMIRGMVAGTNDPYTVLLTPAQYDRAMEQMQDATLSGVGIHLELDRARQGQLTVVEPIAGGPAQQAGLQAGDAILRIGGRETAGMDLETATSLIRGAPGTTVTLEVRRSGKGHPLEFTIPRARVEVASVTSRMLPGRVGLIRLRVFGRGTASDFSDQLARLRTEGARSLIVDLRNNSGGYLLAALDVCGHFVAPRLAGHGAHRPRREAPGTPVFPLADPDGSAGGAPGERVFGQRVGDRGRVHEGPQGSHPGGDPDPGQGLGAGAAPPPRGRGPQDHGGALHHAERPAH